MYLIIGGNGYLGSYLIKNILEKTKETIVATYHNSTPFCDNSRLIWHKTDVSKRESVQELYNHTISVADSPIKCVYLAGYIKPDDVYSNPLLAWDINIGGLVNFLSIFKKEISCFYFASTDMAVGESINDYHFKETDAPHPVNLYGQMKLAGEQIVHSLGFNVFRFPLMLGRSLIPGRPHFIEHIERVVKNRENFEILADYYESSLDYNTVASLIVEIIEKYGSCAEKTLHVCGDEKISKYEIAQRFCDTAGLDKSYLKPLALKDCTFFKAKRCNILLDNSLLKNLLNLSKIKIMEGLK